MVSSSVASKSAKLVKSVSIEKDNQPLTTKLLSEAKVRSTAITGVRGGENNLRDYFSLQSDAMPLPSIGRVEEVEIEEGGNTSADAETVVNDEGEEFKETDGRDESLIQPEAGLGQEIVQENEEEKHIFSETQLHIKDKNQFNFMVDIGPSKTGKIKRISKVKFLRSTLQRDISAVLISRNHPSRRTIILTYFDK